MAETTKSKGGVGNSLDGLVVWLVVEDYGHGVGIRGVFASGGDALRHASRFKNLSVEFHYVIPHNA